jgi:hypothetical protein
MCARARATKSESRGNCIFKRAPEQFRSPEDTRLAACRYLDNTRASYLSIYLSFSLSFSLHCSYYYCKPCVNPYRRSRRNWIRRVIGFDIFVSIVQSRKQAPQIAGWRKPRLFCAIIWKHDAVILFFRIKTVWTHYARRVSPCIILLITVSYWLGIFKRLFSRINFWENISLSAYQANKTCLFSLSDAPMARLKRRKGVVNFTRLIFGTGDKALTLLLRKKHTYGTPARKLRSCSNRVFRDIPAFVDGTRYQLSDFNYSWNSICRLNEVRFPNRVYPESSRVSIIVRNSKLRNSIRPGINLI